jgi:hypothetical protein
MEFASAAVYPPDADEIAPKLDGVGPKRSSERPCVDDGRRTGAANGGPVRVADDDEARGEPLAREEFRRKSRFVAPRPKNRGESRRWPHRVGEEVPSVLKPVPLGLMPLRNGARD